MSIYKTAQEAVKAVSSNSRVYVQGAASIPQQLINALTERHSELRNVEMCHILLGGKTPYLDVKYKDSFSLNTLFIGANERHTIKAGTGSYTPVFLSEVPSLFKRNILPVDVAFINVSPPDKHGYCSLGVTLVGAIDAIENAKIVIAQVNPRVPRTHGEGNIHISKIDILVEVDEPLCEYKPVEPNEIEKKIGDNIAELIEDGSTLQLGIGNIPDAVLSRLHNHKDLGLHTEMFADGVIDLIKKGVINGSKKVIHKNKGLATFIMGSQRLYDFVDDNPYFEFRPSNYTNDPANIRKNPKAIAINSAIEVDVTGQICADSIGPNLYSGIGGQVDFIRGASLSEGGKAIIALPSTTKKGESKIVPFLKSGAGVVTTRGHAHYIVTEYGVANLFGKSVVERVKAMINIAHPNHREAIDKAYFEATRN